MIVYAPVGIHSLGILPLASSTSGSAPNDTCTNMATTAHYTVTSNFLPKRFGEYSEDHR